MKEIKKNHHEKDTRNKQRIQKKFHKLFPGLNSIFYEDSVEQNLYKKFRVQDNENGTNKYS